MYHDLPIENIFSIISHVSLPEGRSLSRNHGWNHGFSTWFVVQNWDHDRFKHWWTQKWNDAVSIGDPRWPSLRSSAWGRNTSGFSTSSVPASKTGVRFSIDIWKDSVSWRPLPRSFLEVRGHIAGIIWPQKKSTGKARWTEDEQIWESDGIWPGPNRVLHWCFGLVTVQYVGIHFSLVLSIKVNIPNIATLQNPIEVHRFSSHSSMTKPCFLHQVRSSTSQQQITRNHLRYFSLWSISQLSFSQW